MLVYIVIVGLVYNFTIRSTWIQPIPEVIYDNILHIVVPLLYVIRWGIYIPKGTLKWQDGLVWLIYPLVYLLYSLIRGVIVTWYPYFFINLIQLSYPEVIRNVLLLIFGFFVIGLLLIAIDRVAKEKQHKNIA